MGLDFKFKKEKSASWENAHLIAFISVTNLLKVLSHVKAFKINTHPTKIHRLIYSSLTLGNKIGCFFPHTDLNIYNMSSRHANLLQSDKDGIYILRSNEVAIGLHG